MGPSLLLTSNKYFSKAGAGATVGENLNLPAGSFTDDNGNAITSFPSYSYFNLFINGMLQPNGVTALTSTQIVIIGGSTLDPADPIAVELVLLQQLSPTPAPAPIIITNAVVPESPNFSVFCIPNITLTVPPRIVCSGTLTGTVTCNKRPFPGASVTLSTSSSAVIFSPNPTITDPSGNFLTTVSVASGTSQTTVTIMATITVNGRTGLASSNTTVTCP
ncbi:DUF4183 domain-containing protein (plasmid) [Alicyclobacillus fastidiosus]|uniref:DUF4183 domain-containing protein n=1 Tax=Alicyclobacillus fastidiosus TaxID=392011 RepID=A0ABY6ZSA8_9BACL|nr:DUF4183 domain-containing protein [Alicyclobacillus fastidiosus]WAH45021.1 DUF4183 domain-containing protein [Alicyclobacillus fastidiosus]